jgi:YD repeat-containing protein
MTYSYNPVNRPIQIVRSTGECVTSIYNCFGKRIRVIDPNGSGTTFVYDGEDMIMEIS